MNWLNCEEPKNSRTAAAAGFALIRSCGITVSMSTDPIRSRIARSMRNNPSRYWFSISSPTDRTRRLPRLSMSRTVSGASSPSRMFIFTRPTADKSYRSPSKNKPRNSASAVSGVGGSPGRITR